MTHITPTRKALTLLSSFSSNSSLLAVAFLALSSGQLIGQEKPSSSNPPPSNSPKQLEHDLVSGGTVHRAWKSVLLTPESDIEWGSMQLPRFFASIRHVGWINEQGKVIVRKKSPASEIVVTPEPEHWLVAWKERPENARQIRISFDQPPVLNDEVGANKPSGDGGFRLQACMASTSGEKIRYEPQQHKNTVGYWVGANDYAEWTIEVAQPGSFNVSILQGCGANQGGSHAAVRLLNGTSETAKLDFVVEETGHFQNFKWRQIGELSIPAKGTYTIRVQPEKIANNALMDIREMQLVRQPASK